MNSKHDACILALQVLSDSLASLRSFNHHSCSSGLDRPQVPECKSGVYECIYMLV